MIVYLIFLIFSFVWLLILFLGPYLFAFGEEFGPVKEIYYLLFSIICHQKPERSYFIWGYQMPVCIRCFGIYLGLFIGIIIYPLFKKIQSTVMPKFKYLWYFLTPLAIDGIAQTLNLYESSHYIRLFTGILASIGIVFYILPVANKIYFQIKQGK
jgi:uncharacterized membrane protein